MSDTTPRIGIFGVGAIGSSVAADLIDAGHEPFAVDQWPDHVEAIRRDGLRVTMPDRTVEARVDVHHVTDLAAVRPSLDIVFLAVKSYDTRWMTELARLYLAPDGVVVGLQNGMNDERIGAIVGTGRTVGCVVELSAEVYTPGIVQRDTPRDGTWFAVGELDGSSTDRIAQIADLLRNVAKVDVSDDIESSKWTKLVANSMTMGPFGLLGLKNWEAADLPGMFEISIRLGRESLAVGQALGHRIQPVFGLTAEEFAGSSDEVLATALRTLMKHVGKDATTATVQDRLKGRLTEQSSITGEVVARGQDVGVPTPVNDAVLGISEEIDRGERTMDPANLELLKSRIPRA